MSMDLFIARTVTTKASLVFSGLINITESQVDKLIIVYTCFKCSCVLKILVSGILVKPNFL